MSIEVLDVSGLALIEDVGRPGQTSSGLSASGAYDRGALRQANLLVGNGSGAAGIEALVTDLTLRATESVLLAVTGAAGPVAIDNGPSTCGRALYLERGSCLQLGAPSAGVRYYIAVRGGITTPAVLGSRSTDTMARIGAAPLAAGECLPAGTPDGNPAADDVPTGIMDSTLDVVLGPRDDWFTQDAHTALLSDTWRISGSADRIGVRLEGPRLDRISAAELPSEPCVRGGIQVDRSGQPIVLGPDHPVTGGYPVIGVVTNPDALAQIAPGQSVWFSRQIAP